VKEEMTPQKERTIITFLSSPLVVTWITKNMNRDDNVPPCTVNSGYYIICPLIKFEKHLDRDIQACDLSQRSIMPLKLSLAP